MKPMSTKEHLIFDIDGTLWDTTAKVAEAFNMGIKDDPRLSSVYPLTPERLSREFGLPLHEIGRHLFPMLPSDECDALTDHLCDLEIAHLLKYPPLPYEGVPETLRALSKVHDLYIISNCQAGYAETFMEATGLGPFFLDHLCPGDTGLLKADNIALLMEKYGLDEAVYIGDTEGDRLSARKAGVGFVHAAYGFGEVSEADAVINCFSDLAGLYL